MMNKSIHISALSALLFLALITGLASAQEPGERRHLVFWAGTPQQLDVYKIRGREDGPTVMIIGGIQGDEPGGYMSADLYADMAMKRGHLIVVPRASFKSIVQSHRGPDGDMNRKFWGDLSRDPDRKVVEVLKELMAESDLVLNLHDGSGFYRPVEESQLAGPHRYGQCIIADADVYTHKVSGAILPLGDYAREAVRRVNQEIDEPLYKFHFFDTKTDEPNSRHKEQRGSVTYYALTQLGIPAFGVETSKQLPSLEMKIYQHNLAINALLDIFGLEPELPRLDLEPPALAYVLVSVNEGPPIALADGQTLELTRDDSLEVVDIRASHERGLSADVLGLGSFNDLRSPLVINNPTAIVVQKDTHKIGRVNIVTLPPEQAGRLPRVTGLAKIVPPKTGTPVIREEAPAVTASADETDTSVTRPIEFRLPERDKPIETPPPDSPEAETQTPEQSGDQPDGRPTEAEVVELRSGPGRVTAFLLEVDGQPVELEVGGRLDVATGSLVKMVDLKSDGDLPEQVVMNLRGFVPKSKQDKNDGQDKGFTADTGRDLMSAFSLGQKGQIYPLNAEVSREVLASASIRLVQPRLASVTLEVDGQSHTIKAWGRLGIPTGSQFTVTGVELAGGLSLGNPKFTLGGVPFSADLPQTLTMPSFNANLAVFSGETLTGKVTLVAK